jgi:putative ATPase
VDLFSSSLSINSAPATPLAETLRPKKVQDILGQEKCLGPDSLILRKLKEGQLPSTILWGPPGSGKTTFARALSTELKARFISIHAVNTGAKEIRELGEEGRNRRLMYQESTVLFIDEIHRLNKSQQDVLLPYVESGDLVLVGATTENPAYEVNSALLSRCHLVRFERLSKEALTQLIKKATDHFKIPFEEFLDDSAVEKLVENADGDGRRLLNLVESAALVYRQTPQKLTSETLGKIFEQTPLNFDKKGSAHYDTISAFIKSIRGSDPNASIYYLARMLEGGEDPLFIARRLVILASEDVGNADPRAISVAVACTQAVELIGLPEAAINLAQAVTYLASCPKSNRSYMALKKAQEFVKKTGSLPVPENLRSNSYGINPKDRNYEYPHDLERPYSQQNYLPKEAASANFYEPSEFGFEKQIAKYLEWLKTGKSDSTLD